jgi:hypothetical protein
MPQQTDSRHEDQGLGFILGISALGAYDWLLAPTFGDGLILPIILLGWAIWFVRLFVGSGARTRP